MYRAFQTAMGVHKPDVVFVLGEFCVCMCVKFGHLNHEIPGIFFLGSALKCALDYAFYI
jgi:hypothetical protein